MEKPRPLRPPGASPRLLSCEILFLYPLFLVFCAPLACVCVRVSPSARRVCELSAPSHWRARPPLAVNATCPRYPAVRSELEHCEPLPLRGLPLARSRPPPAEHHPVSNKALLSKME